MTIPTFGKLWLSSLLAAPLCLSLVKNNVNGIFFGSQDGNSLTSYYKTQQIRARQQGKEIPSGMSVLGAPLFDPTIQTGMHRLETAFAWHYTAFLE